jgi:hypothetical protein
VSSKERDDCLRKKSNDGIITEAKEIQLDRLYEQDAEELTDKIVWAFCGGKCGNEEAMISHRCPLS